MSLEEEASDQLLMALQNDELHFNSTTSNELSKALQDDTIDQILLIGQWGSGKTALVKTVRDKVKNLRIFDAVLFINMSKNSNPTKIRDLIAESLNREFRKAKEIKSTFGRMNKILVILDDIYHAAEIDPEDIDIPRQRCKLLATTRDERGELMKDSGRLTIPMGPLSPEDAWRLLQEHLGIFDDDESPPNKLLNAAKEIVLTCNKFPGTIMEIGHFLKEEFDKDECHGLLDSLRHLTARYQIYISYSGMDTRDQFASYLSSQLRRIGFITKIKNDLIKDDERERRLIEESRLSIVVLTESYLGSLHFMNELVHILECSKKNKQLVWPIFYGVEPSDIKNLTGGAVQRAMAKLEDRFRFSLEDFDRYQDKWKDALFRVCQLQDQWTHRPGIQDHELIKGISDAVTKAKSYLYVQSMRTNSDMAMETEWRKVNCEFELYVSPDQLLMALEGELGFNSTTLKELSKELQDHTINIIGLHGKRGSGKTTLVEALVEKAKSLKIFDEVLFATVSQNPNIRSIQDQIARLLDLEFVEHGTVGRAGEIRSKLANKKRILVILDDAPAKFDSEYIGIPCTDERCKFLLTTQDKQHCTLMIGETLFCCQTMIPMGPISPEVSWRLLQEHSSIEDDDSNLSNLGKEIAYEYAWRPGSIIEVGISLKGKLLEEWQGLLNSLRHSTARHQIFLSFRGTDTRHNFTKPLCDELRKNGFKTFVDETGLRNGDSISIELIKAIEDSRLSIVILSEHYSDSAWCLDELVHILECNKTKKQLVWPIFYKVEPTHVRHQTGDFGNAMAGVKKGFKSAPEKIKKWKSALVEVAKLSGQSCSEEEQELEFIQKYVELVKEAKNYLFIRDMDIVSQAGILPRERTVQTDPKAEMGDDKPKPKKCMKRGHLVLAFCGLR